MLGGGGLVAANVYASATEGGWGGQNGPDATGQVKSAAMATIDCPDVGGRLTDVPDGARADVDRQLAELDQQTAAAYQQLQASEEPLREDPHAADDSIMNPLEEKRSATIERIAVAIDQVGDRPEGLESLAACTLRPGLEGTGGESGGTGQATATATPGGGAQQGGGQGRNGSGRAGAGQGGNGPVASDYADITAVQPDVPRPAQQADASRGSFTSDCGANANGLRNSDNVIVAPGVSNGAHHFHDYVGNQSNNAFAGDDDLAKADTSCVDKGDRSTYYWPVLRLQNGEQERDAGAPGGGTEGNAGRIVTPKQVTLAFVGNPRSKVTAMPRLLRIVTGDAKAFVNGPVNANASWSCTGYEDRRLKDKYPLCPSGSDVVRTFRFQSCWDGRNTDSANHRTHVAFAGPDGSCPEGFRAIPQLVQRIVYDVAAPSIGDGGRTVPLFAVDSFPEQLHKPVTDHGDFVNVFDASLMGEMVDCINYGRTCGPGGGGGTSSSPAPGTGSGATAEPGAGASAGPAPAVSTPSEPPRTDATVSPAAPAHTTEHSAPSRQRSQSRQGSQSSQSRQGSTSKQDDQSRQGTDGGDRRTKPGGQSSTHGESTAPAEAGTSVSAAPSASDAGEIGQATQTPAPGSGRTTPPAAQSDPQAVHGSLAETGAGLWPAALGTLLALSGLVMLIRAKRPRY